MIFLDSLLPNFMLYCFEKVIGVSLFQEWLGKPNLSYRLHSEILGFTNFGLDIDVCNVIAMTFIQKQPKTWAVRPGVGDLTHDFNCLDSVRDRAQGCCQTDSQFHPHSGWTVIRALGTRHANWQNWGKNWQNWGQNWQKWGQKWRNWGQNWQKWGQNWPWRHYWCKPAAGDQNRGGFCGPSAPLVAQSVWSISGRQGPPVTTGVGGTRGMASSRLAGCHWHSL